MNFDGYCSAGHNKLHISEPAIHNFFNQEKIGRKKNMHSDDQRHKETLKTRQNKQTKNVGKRVDKDETQKHTTKNTISQETKQMTVTNK